MSRKPSVTASIRVVVSHHYKVNVNDHLEQLSWHHSEGGEARSVNLIVTQKVVGDKLGKPRVVARLNQTEGEAQARAIYLDYARRHGPEGQESWPLPLMVAADTEVDEDIEFGKDTQLPMFGAPR